MTHARSGLALALFLICGCATAPQVPAPTPAELDLANAIRSMNEKTSRDEDIAISPTRTLPEIDFRSTLEIDFDDTKLKSISAALGTGRTEVEMPADSPLELSARLHAEQLMPYVRNLLLRNRELDDAVGRFRQGEAIDLDALNADIAANAKMELRLAEMADDLIRELARIEGQRQGHPAVWNEAKGQFDDETTRAIQLDLIDRVLSKGPVIEFSPEGLSELFDAEYELLRQLAEEDVKALETELADSDTIQLRVRASIVRDGKEIHVPVLNYDRVQLGAGPIKKAVSFDLSDEEVARLEEDFETVNEFAGLVNDLRDKESELRKSLRDLDETLRMDVKELEAELDGLLQRLRGSWSELMLERAAAFVENLIAAPPAGFPEDALEGLRKTMEALRAAKASVAELLTLRERAAALVSYFDEQQDKPAAEVVLGLVQGTTNLLNDAKEAVNAIPGKVKTVATAVAAMRTSLDEIAGFLAGEAKKEAESIAAELGTPAAIHEFAEGIASAYPGVWGKIGKGLDVLHSLLGRKRLLAGGRRLDEVHVDVRARGLDEVVPAKIFVNNTVAGKQRDDQLLLRVELVGKNADREEEVRLAHAQALDVVRRGLYNSWETPLVFVERKDEPGGAVAETNFEAAPSVAWTLHYRKLEGTDGADRWASTWNTVDPGLGIHVAALNFENDGVEVGMGVQLSFFHDLLQLGYGWNLSVDEDRPYFSIGVGLIQGFNAVSSIVPIGE